VECFDDNYQGNKYKDASIRKSHSSQRRRHEILYDQVAPTIEEITKSLCDPQKRRCHNKMTKKLQNSKHVKVLKLFGKKHLPEKSLNKDVKELCHITLRNTDGKQQTLLLLRNMHSFIYFLIKKIINGIYSQGVAILEPPMYTTMLRPLPSTKTLTNVFGIKLTKYAECMKCIQYIMEKKSFIKHLSNQSDVC